MKAEQRHRWSSARGAVEPAGISADEVRAQLAAIVESSADAIISTSLDGVIRTWNAGAERLFGYSRDEVVGRSVAAIIPPELLGEEEA